MIKFYLTTIIIWMIIIECTMLMFNKELTKKLEKYNVPRDKNLFRALKTLFVVSAVPIIRVFIEIAIIYMVICKQEDFDKLMENYYKE